MFATITVILKSVGRAEKNREASRLPMDWTELLL